MRNAKEINRKSGRTFLYYLSPSIAARSQEDQEDYGIDFELELTDKLGKAVGGDSVFKAQVKGQLNAKRICSDRFVSFSLPIDKIKYYLEFSTPVMLVLVDVTSKEVFWKMITGDQTLDSVVKDKDAQNEYSIRIPTDNKIIEDDEECTENILEAARNAYRTITMRNFKMSILKPHRKIPIDEIILEIKKYEFIAYNEKLDESWKQHDEFRNIIDNARQISNVDLEVKFSLLAKNHVKLSLDSYEKVYDTNQRLLIENAIELLEIARKLKCKQFRLAAISIYRTITINSEIRVFLANPSVDNLNNKNHEQNVVESFILIQEVQKILRPLSKLFILTERLYSNGYYSLLMFLYTQICKSIRHLNILLDIYYNNEFKYLRSWYQNIANISISVAADLKDTLSINIIYANEIEDFNRKQELRKLVESRDKSLIPVLNNIESNLSPLLVNNIDLMPKDFLLSLVINRAKVLGWDPDDENSEFGGVVALGVSNYDRWKYMNKCKYLFVYYKGQNEISKRLSFESSRDYKFLICTKHWYLGYTVGSLHKMYHGHEVQKMEGFRDRFCENCSDCRKRDLNWKENMESYKHEFYALRSTCDQYLNELNLPAVKVIDMKEDTFFTLKTMKNTS